MSEKVVSHIYIYILKLMSVRYIYIYFKVDVSFEKKNQIILKYFVILRIFFNFVFNKKLFSENNVKQSYLFLDNNFLFLEIKNLFFFL